MKKLCKIIGLTVILFSLVSFFICGCSSSLMEKAWNIEGSMYRAVGAPVELAPAAPSGATNVRKEGGRWICDKDDKRLTYNDVKFSWEALP